MVSAKAQELLTRVTKFYASNRWQTIDAANEWLSLIPLLNKLGLQDAIEAFEWIMVCVLMSQTDSHYAGKKSQETPLDECMHKLKKMISVGFWAKIIEIELSTKSEVEARLKVTEFVATLPQFSRSAIKKSMIDADEFPLANYASACLQEPAPNIFAN